jgi:uncharacterized protein
MSNKLIIERDIEAKMRDGVVLRADVYRPDTDEALPVLLQRTPYGKGLSQVPFALMAAERGYAVVIQDTRGRWASEGDNYPLIYEKEDGYDTVEWVARQPWSNGKVGMFGSSYVGYTQLAAAVMHPPALKTIIPSVTFCNASQIGYLGGELCLGVLVSWNLMSTAMMDIMRQPDPGKKQGMMDELIGLADGMATATTFAHLPLAELPLLGSPGTFFRDILENPPDSAYWQRMFCPPDQINIPALHIGGWYDIFVNCTLHDYDAIRTQGNPAQKAIIGPWLHGPMEGLVGDVDFGLRASNALVLVEEVHLRWFDYWLKGIENGIMDESPLRIFVMGENRWRDEPDWPLARTHPIRFYLHSGGSANTRHGNGKLGEETPSDEPFDTFVYDPRHPVPTRGGGLCCWQAALPAGAYDQRQVEERPDVLVYTSAPLEEDLEVTGQVEVHLWAASSAPDTDFTAKLVDVAPCSHGSHAGGDCGGAASAMISGGNGFARNVQDGILRTRYRQQGSDMPLKPGEPYELVIDLGVTSNVFKAGHCIRLEISSSNFPRFAPNPNTGETPGVGTQQVPALQTIFHDTGRPSYILLPVIPK